MSLAGRLWPSLRLALQGERMNARKSALVTFFCCIFSIFSFAQKNEFALSVGVVHSSDQTVTVGGVLCPVGVICIPASSSTSTGVGFEGNYARQLIHLGPASLGVEVPLVGIPGRDVKVSTGGISVPG